MSRTRRTKSTSQKTTAHSQVLQRLMMKVWRPGVLFPVAVGGAIVLLLPFMPRWIPHLDQRAEYQVSIEEILISPPNRFVPQDLIARTVRKAGYVDGIALLDDTLVAKLGEAFSAEPWVKEVRGIRKHRDGRIEVDVVFREPVLMLQTGSGMYAIDAEGVILPPGDFTPEDTHQFPVAVNVRSLPQGPAGSNWGDPAVVGAAQLAATLAPEQNIDTHWKRLHLTAIFIPTPTTARRTLDQIDYELITDGGSRIVWGRAPGADRLEPPVSTKLQKLEFYLQQHGSYEEPKGRCVLDIRPFDVISAQPLSGTMR